VLVVGGFALGGILIYFVVDAGCRYERARRERRDAAAPLPAGGTALVAGRVTADTPAAIVTIEVQQRGKETRYRDRGWQWRWSHVWIETERAIKVAPFVLETARGERVRVSPGEDLVFAAKLDGLTVHAVDLRTRTAALNPNDTAFVVGNLVRGEDGRGEGYRGQGTAIALVPPRMGRMIVSTEVAGARQTALALRSALSAVLVAVALALTHGVLLRDYYALRFSAHSEVAAVRRVFTTVRRSGRSNKIECHAVLFAEGATFEVPTSRAFYDAAFRQGDGATAPVLVAGTAHQIGTEATCSEEALLALTAGVVALAFFLFAYGHSKRRWYERTHLRESGTGRLDPRVVTVD
jgi:hypothetical protein